MKTNFSPCQVPEGLLAASLLVLLLTAGCRGPGDSIPTVAHESEIQLRDEWFVTPAVEVARGGAEISIPGFDTSTWTAATVPTTPLAALVAAGEFEDPYFGRNLEAISVEPFTGPWWYRTEFIRPGASDSKVRLLLEGINYSADVWLNGQQVAVRTDLVGAFRLFELDITPFLRDGGNALAIEVHPPRPGDPTIGFVDWNPAPPDRNMGLWRPVKLRVTGAVSLDEVFVESDLDLDDLSRASLMVSARVSNFADRPTKTSIVARLDNSIEVEQVVELEPGEVRRVVLTPADHPALGIEEPRLWWPNNLGEPNLYSLELTAVVDGTVTDSHEVTFGIREIAEYINEQGHRGYMVNGKPTLIRGGGWVDDLMLADDQRKIEDQLRYVRHMNLNTIRLEGFWGSSQDLYDLADRYGILVMAGWSCQWEWEEYLGGPVDEFGGIDTDEEIELIAESLRDQVIWLRNHPSVFLWVLGSDMLPRPALESRYREVLGEVDTSRPALAACAVATSEVSGPTGVKMNGPYDYVPPSYWYLDTENGGAYGFNTETGPGPQPPPIWSIQRMMPEENWWPVDEMWEYHSGRNEFSNIDRYLEALNQRYGEATDLEDFTRKAQLANYEAMRAMFEAFSVRRPVTTGIIQWMLNSAWPELFWQLYDYYLVPNGAFYATRVANRPVHIVFDYGYRSLLAVNDTRQALSGASVRIRVLDLESQVLHDETMQIDLEAESRQRVSTLPSVGIETGVYFLDLRLLDSSGREAASNFYWLPVEMDRLDWEATEWFYTPIAEFADLTSLARMPKVQLAVDHRFEEAQGGRSLIVDLSNPGDRMAFFVELEMRGAASGDLLVPVEWDDNYVTLLPGERRQIRGYLPDHALNGDDPELRYSGWNVTGE